MPQSHGGGEEPPHTLEHWSMVQFGGNGEAEGQAEKLVLDVGGLVGRLVNEAVDEVDADAVPVCDTEPVPELLVLPVDDGEDDPVVENEPLPETVDVTVCIDYNLDTIASVPSKTITCLR